MLKTRIAKVAGVAVGVSVAFGAFAPAAGALTVAELQAQINALMAQLSSLQGGTTVSTGVNFTSDMTIGSTGSQVSALQQMLVSQGHLVMPAGVAYGYFGSLTRAAVMKWQAANGVSSTGYFGPISRAKANSMGGATGTVPGTTVGGGTVSVGVITTPGVEGTITVSKAPSPASGTKVYEGASRVAVFGIELEAKTSDIKVERIKLDLDETGDTASSDSAFYNKFAQRIYIMDGSTVLASMDLNSSTVVEESNEISITLAGMSYVVPRDAKRVLTVAIDAKSSWDSAYDADSWTVGVPAEGVRGVDGAGVNQYGPTTAFSNSVTSEGDLADSATLTVSLNSGTPQDQVVIAASGTSENERDGLEILKADFRAEKDAVTITDLVVDVTVAGSGTATTSTGYLYDGSTLLDSDSVDTDTHSGFTFDDIDFTIAKDSTKTLTLKVDIDSANGTATTFVADIDTADVTSENSTGNGVTESGSATGETITVRNVGLEYTLVSKNVTYTAGGGFAGATSTAKSDFVVRIKAVGSAIEFGDTGSTTYAFADQNSTLQGDESFVIYVGGSATNPDVSSSTAITIPSGVSAAGDANSWILGEGNTVDIAVSYVMETRDDDSYALITTGAYAFGLERLNWLTLSGGRQSDTFMAANSAWRTSTVTLP